MESYKPNDVAWLLRGQSTLKYSIKLTRNRLSLTAYLDGFLANLINIALAKSTNSKLICWVITFFYKACKLPLSLYLCQKSLVESLRKLKIHLHLTYYVTKWKTFLIWKKYLLDVSNQEKIVKTSLFKGKRLVSIFTVWKFLLDCT